jgi:hypothetical protein
VLDVLTWQCFIRPFSVSKKANVHVIAKPKGTCKLGKEDNIT